MEDFKKDTDRNTIIVGDYNIPMSKMDRSSKQNINMDILALNKTLEQMDITDIYRTFHPKEGNYAFFSGAHGIFSKIDHMIGHKTSLKKFKKIEIISSIFSDHKGLKLEINLKEIIWYLSFTTWLISLSIMLSSSIHAVTKGRSSFFHCIDKYHMISPSTGT